MVDDLKPCPLWTDRELLRNEVDVYVRRLQRDGETLAYVEGFGDTWTARWPGGLRIQHGPTEEAWPTEAACMAAAEASIVVFDEPVVWGRGVGGDECSPVEVVAVDREKRTITVRGRSDDYRG